MELFGDILNKEDFKMVVRPYVCRYWKARFYGKTFTIVGHIPTTNTNSNFIEI